MNEQIHQQNYNCQQVRVNIWTSAYGIGLQSHQVIAWGTRNDKTGNGGNRTHGILQNRTQKHKIIHKQENSQASQWQAWQGSKHSKTRETSKTREKQLKASKNDTIRT